MADPTSGGRVGRMSPHGRQSQFLTRAIENVRGQDRHSDGEGMGGGADDVPGDGVSHMVNIAVEVEYPAIEGTPPKTIIRQKGRRADWAPSDRAPADDMSRRRHLSDRT
jgi:hypothetical protein